MTGIIGTLLLAFYALTLAALFFWGVLSSFKGALEFQMNLFGKPQKAFKDWLDNYVYAFEELYVLVNKKSGGQRQAMLFEMFFWSITTSFIPSAINVIFTALCMYTLAKYKFGLRDTIYNIFLVVMILPIIGSLPSNLEFIHKIGMYDNILWLLVSSCQVWTGQWLILYATYKSISLEYAEAAFIDGAGHHRVFWSIIFPMSAPTIFVLILLSFITKWNDYQFSLIWYPSYPTLAYGLYDFQNSKANAASSEPVQIAAAIMSALPSLTLFVCFKDKMMKSLTMGGLKG